MPEHWTRNTLEVTAYCNKCADFTQHRVDGGRRGPCIACIDRLILKSQVQRIRKGLEQEQREEHDRQNPTLFESLERKR